MLIAVTKGWKQNNGNQSLAGLAIALILRQSVSPQVSLSSRYDMRLWILYGMASMVYSKKLSILVVEDDDQVRLAIADALCLVGHDVSSVDCAESVAELSNRIQLDIAIIDVNLPDETGFSLAKRLRVSQPKLGIIMLSASSETNSRSIGYESGADIYLAKPIQMNVLISAINAVKRRLSLDELASQSDLKLDTQTMTLRWKSDKIEVSNAEGTLLLAFANAPQKVLKNSDISTILEIENGPKTKALIELRMSRLRKKIPQVKELHKPIRSIHGQGYQLCVPLIIV